ncbi:NF-kappa-B inhibitor beta-like isoform X2 [Pristis pectinata]|uniref:NF-kappa-B inhibitor beta-like isoform X2 n=1 Tax=Pristis pectinata TaxID=685728 RepID=UPI00223E412C|nr:NF-kappa-B inhibitor beta-like isoform X2 [Pristis pectinata]
MEVLIDEGRPKVGAGKAAAPWGGEAEAEDHYDSGIGSLSELQSRQFGPLDEAKAAGEPEPDVWPSSQQRLECGIGQITRRLERVELRGGEQSSPPGDVGRLLGYRTEDLDSMLHLAIIHEEDCLLEHLLYCTKGTDFLDLQNDMKQTALHLAVILGRPELVKKLIAAGANLLLQEKDGNTALHLACKEMALACVQALLFHHSSDLSYSNLLDPSQFRQQLHFYNYRGFTPLHVAVLLNDVQIVEYLLHFEVDVNAKEKCAGRTALHLGVEQQNRHVVKLLLNRGADVHAQMYNGCTPICLAVYMPDSGITQMLRDYGSSEPLTDDESDEDEGIDEDGVGEYDDFVVHGC